MTTIECPHCGGRIQFRSRRSPQSPYRISLTDKGREWLAADKEARG